MKSKAKKEICPLPERIRKRITLSIDPDHHDFIKNAGFNASRFFDSAINALRTNTEYKTILIGAHTNPESSNEAQNRWACPDSNRRSSPCKGFKSSSELGEKRFGSDVDPALENFSEVRGDSIGLTLQAFYTSIREPFSSWLNRKVKNKEITEKSVKSYLSAVDRLMASSDDIFKPQDLQDVEGDKQTRGLRNFYNFIEDEKDQDQILDEPLTKWRRYTKIRPAGVVEIYPTDQEIIDAYLHISPDHKTLYLSLMYTGNRLSQVLRTLQTLDKSDIIYAGPKKQIAHISAAQEAAGTKQAYRLFFPAFFIPDLIEYVESPASQQAYDTVRNAISHERVSPKTIRKWHLNFMIDNGVSESIADFIQGRTPQTVGSAHYLNKIKGATEAFIHLMDKYPVSPRTGPHARKAAGKKKSPTPASQKATSRRAKA